MQINEITYTQIENLIDTELSRLLLHLLRSEQQKYRLDGVNVLVPLKINVADAGEDGRIKCLDTNGSNYILNKFSLFQCKATNVQPVDVYAEFFEKTKRKRSDDILVLKTQIKEVLDKEGQYVFFIGHAYNQQLKDSRRAKAIEAIEYCNTTFGTKYLHSQVRILEANEITEWVNTFLDSVILTQKFNGIHRPIGLQSIDDLATYRLIADNTFHSNSKLDNYISVIQNTMESEQSSLRIIGHSGLGKTRLVYEALKQSARGKNSVYYNVISNSDEIIQFINTYGGAMQGVLVCDNCDYHTHKLLKQEIERTSSKFKLISIDYDVNESVDISKKQTVNYLILSKYDYLDIVKNILNEKFRNRLSPSQIDQIASYSEGFPGMAVLFAQVRLDGNDDIVEFLEEDFLDRLAFGRDWDKRDPDKFQVLLACSVFSFFGHPDSADRNLLTSVEKDLYQNQKKFIIEKICDPKISERKFSESAEYFISKKVLERRGHFLSVRPTPLAVRLAMKWWKHTSSAYLLSIFPELEKLNLAVPLCSRLSELNQLQETKQVVNELWGPNSPFGSAEVLNTKLGSQLFRSVAQVNPSVAISTLEYIFGKYEIDELSRNVGPGRRYIVWTLEMLAFRKELFERAAFLLFRFAAAENEQISNNATGQLNQLFHVRLSGTEADLAQRISVIDNVLELGDARFDQILIDAVSNGFEAFHFNRLSGAEQQGLGSELIEYYPSGSEIKNYWEQLSERLVAIAKSSAVNRDKIKNVFASAIRGFFATGVGYLVKSAIESYQSIDNSFWREAIIQIKASKKHENLSDEDRNLIEYLLKALSPVNISDRLKLFVTSPDWDTEKVEDEYIDKAGIKAEQLADELVKNNEDFLPAIKVVLNGEQRKAIEFGKKLGALLKSANVAEVMLQQLETINETEQNSDVIGAYISMLPRDEAIKLIEKVAENSLLSRHAFDLMLHQELRPTDVLFLVNLLDDKKTDIEKFYRLGYNFYFRNYEVETVKDLLTSISQRDDSAFIVLELIDFYLRGSDDQWNDFRELARSLIMNNNLIINLRNHSEYTWYKFVERLLVDADDIEFVEKLTAQLIDSIRTDSYLNFDNYLGEIFKIVIKAHFNIFWQLVGPAVLNSETYFPLKSFLGSSNGYLSSTGLLEFANYNGLVAWCKEEAPQSYQRIAYMMPLTHSESPTRWHSLALLMFDNFGDQEDFLDSVDANMRTFGSVGSDAPYYENQIILLQLLFDHPKKTVQTWARRLLEQMDLRARRSKIDDQNFYISF